MNKNFSDEQLDQILRKAVKDSLPDEDTLNEIADSPRLWWNVKSSIERENASRGKGWIPTWVDWQIVVFASVILAFCAGLFLFLNSPKNDLIAEQKTPEKISVEIPKPIEKPFIVDSLSEIPKVDKTEKKLVHAKSSTKNLPKNKVRSDISNKPQIAKNAPKKLSKAVEKSEELKTDFIALAYSPAPESGQILKVKVPRSMMVSLGVINKTENGTELVNAEVLVGNDGSAHAIRFTR